MGDGHALPDAGGLELFSLVQHPLDVAGSRTGAHRKQLGQDAEGAGLVERMARTVMADGHSLFRKQFAEAHGGRFRGL